MKLQIWLLVAQVVATTRGVLVPAESSSLINTSTPLQQELHLTPEFEEKYNYAIENYPPYFDPKTGLKNQHANTKRHRIKGEIPMYNNLVQIAKSKGDKKKVQFYTLFHGQTPSAVLSQDEAITIRRNALYEAGFGLDNGNGGLNKLQKAVIMRKYKEGMINLGIASSEWLQNREIATKEEKKLPFAAINERKKLAKEKTRRGMLENPNYKKNKRRSKNVGVEIKGKEIAKNDEINDGIHLRESSVPTTPKAQSPMKQANEKEKELYYTQLPSSGEETESDGFIPGRESFKIASRRLKPSKSDSRKIVDLRSLYAKIAQLAELPAVSQEPTDGNIDLVLALRASKIERIHEAKRENEGISAISEGVKRAKGKGKGKGKGVKQASAKLLRGRSDSPREIEISSSSESQERIADKGKRVYPDLEFQEVAHQAGSTSFENALPDQANQRDFTVQHHHMDHGAQDPYSLSGHSNALPIRTSPSSMHQNHQDDTNLWLSPDYHKYHFWSDPLYHLTRPLSPHFAGVLPHELAPPDHSQLPHHDEHDHFHFGQFD